MNPKIPPLFKGGVTSAPAKATPPTAVKPSTSAQNATAPAAQNSPRPAPSAPALTGEALMQRLRYFENLVDQKDQYIAQLQAAVARQGGAVPTAYFAPLSGVGGTYTPKSG